MLARRAIATGIFGQIPLNRQIANLFRNGEQGAWYDISDWSTLFQDSAGTTPVTAVGQPVGKMLDKSGRGNHATQPTTINRPVLSARVNLLTKTELPLDAVWARQAGAAAPLPNNAIAPDGSLTATTLSWTGVDASYYQGFAGVVGMVYSANMWIQGQAGQTIDVWSDFASNTDHQTIALTGAWQQVSSLNKLMTGSTSGNIAVRRTSLNTASTVNFWHPQLESGSVATRYQRVNTAADYDTVGFTHYLAFNGTNSWMSTAAIDLTGTDKMTGCLGVKKAIDHTGVIAELSAITDGANPGSFIAHAATNNSYIVACRGSAINIRNYTGQSSGISHVMHTAIDFSVAGEGEVITRINALPVFGGTSDGGSSTFGNYPIYIGSRGGSSLFLNGNIYGLIIRGAASTDTQISATEKFINQKTGAY